MRETLIGGVASVSVPVAAALAVGRMRTSKTIRLREAVNPIDQRSARRTGRIAAEPKMLSPFRRALISSGQRCAWYASICIGDGAELILLRHALGGERFKRREKCAQQSNPSARLAGKRLLFRRRLGLLVSQAARGAHQDIESAMGVPAGLELAAPRIGE